MLKDFVTCGLSCAGGTHKHDTKTDIECFEQLNRLQDKNLMSLKFENIDRFLDLGQELTVIGVCNFN